MSNPAFEGLPKYPEDEEIAEDLLGIHSEDPLFSSEVKKIIGLEPSKDSRAKPETTSADFEKIKQLVLTNHNLKEFLIDVEEKFRSNIDEREKEMKELANELKELSDKVKY